MTDTLGAMSGARDASISVGAITVQPGGTGVILAGTAIPTTRSIPITVRASCARLMGATRGP
jgi:hypothetical protein